MKSATVCQQDNERGGLKSVVNSGTKYFMQPFVFHRTIVQKRQESDQSSFSEKEC